MQLKTILILTTSPFAKVAPTSFSLNEICPLLHGIHTFDTQNGVVYNTSILYMAKIFAGVIIIITSNCHYLLHLISNLNNFFKNFHFKDTIQIQYSISCVNYFLYKSIILHSLCSALLFQL